MSIGDRPQALREQKNMPVHGVERRMTPLKVRGGDVDGSQSIQGFETLETCTNDAPLTVPGSSRHWTASIVSSPVEIAKLDPFVKSLEFEPGPLVPNFFLASVSAQGWRPCVVVISEGRQTVGVLYCKERIIAGIGLRMVFGDDSLGAMIAAPRHEMKSVLNFGVRTLVERKLALRLQFSPRRVPDIRNLPPNTDVRILQGSPNAHLKLPSSFDDFIAGLGPRTRRNVRNYRRKNIVAGNTWEFVTDFLEFSKTARRLFPTSAHARSRREMESALTLIGAMPSRFMITLRALGGEWIGLAGGWCVGRRAYMNMQLNDLTHSQLSVSLVLRSYLIEEFIARGMSELVFLGGSSAPLDLYCDHPEVIIMSIDKRSRPWHLVRQTWTRARKLVPNAFDNKMVRLFLKGL